MDVYIGDRKAKLKTMDYKKSKALNSIIFEVVFAVIKNNILEANFKKKFFDLDIATSDD